PVFFLKGVAYYLFTPLARAVVFAMMASYFLSRTVAPTMANFLLGAETHHPEGQVAERPNSVFGRVHWHFIRGFEWTQSRYVGLLERAMRAPVLVVIAAVSFVVLSLVIFIPFLGRDFFPQVDAGQFRLHVRAPSGTRIEETERIFGQVENVIRAVVPESELDLILDNIGLTQSFTIMAYVDNGTVSDGDGEILVSLKPNHGPTANHVARLRDELP